MIRYDTDLTFDLVWMLTGSVYKKAFKRLLPACILAGGFAIWRHYDREHFDMVGGSFENAFAYSIYTYLLGFILVFRCNMAYQRFWEGRSSIEKMTNCWIDAAIKIISFDKHCNKMDEENIRAWRGKMLGLFSLLHGSALAALTEYEQSVEVFNGVDEHCQRQLNLLCVRDQTYLIYSWIQDEIMERREQGGMNAPPPIATRIWGDLCNGMQGYNDADMVLDTPFPFPYSQILAILLLMLVGTCGYIMLAFVDSIVWVMLLVGVATGTFHGLNEVAKELEQPFGDDTNDLPMQEYQHNFNNRMQQLFYLGEHIYEAPGPSKAAKDHAAAYSNKFVPAQQTPGGRNAKELKLAWREPIYMNDEAAMKNQRRRSQSEFGLTM